MDCVYIIKLHGLGFGWREQWFERTGFVQQIFTHMTALRWYACLETSIAHQTVVAFVECMAALS